MEEGEVILILRHTQSHSLSLDGYLFLCCAVRYTLRGKNSYNLFFADDKKELGAARRSQYYMKYGNPNYGGMKGILSNSW